MVHAEFTEDYYAALELPPSATANEIKKQFKKLALQYHPDRNPSGDTTAKFQAIQAANEVLTDPQQRAKYDAQRIRSGLLHTYTEAPPPPPRTNAASRSPTSNFAPPPRPPPFNPRSKFSPPPSGAQKYARFNMPDTPPSWRARHREEDEVKTKTNDFKAWEHMRHGQGPIPRARAPEASRTTRPMSFQPGQRPAASDARQSNGPTIPKRTTAGRTDWESMPDAGMPNLHRANTTSRASSKPSGYTPAAPRVNINEPQARSAFFNVSRGERPPASRTQTSMPPPSGPPPSAGRAPTSKRPEPASTYTTSNGANGMFAGNERVRTQYPKMHGEKTDLKSPRSHGPSLASTPRDSNSRTDFYDSEPINIPNRRPRASPSKPSQSGKTSVSTTSSDDSSDEAEAANLAKSAYLRPKQNPKSRRPHMPAGAPQRSFFNPYVTGPNGGDEPMASRSTMGGAAYNGPRRHSGIDMPTSKLGNDHPEGFMEHRKKHEAEAHQQASSVPTDSTQTHFMQRPRSFDEHFHRKPEDNNTPLANRNPSIFQWPIGDLPKPYTASPPPRSQSAENINIDFSPSGNPPRFGEAYMSQGNTNDNPIDINGEDGKPASQFADANTSSSTGANVGPPPKGPACFFPNDWHHRFDAGTFQGPISSSQARAGTSKRAPGTPKASFPNYIKRPPNSATFQASVHDPGEEPPLFTNVEAEEVPGGRDSSNGSAMDIDPVLTPPSGGDNQSLGKDQEPSPTRPDGKSKAWNQGPPLPPRSAASVQGDDDSLNLGMKDFQHIKPFGASQGGLTDLDDLSSTLPFESGVSSTMPKPMSASESQKMPKPPKAPSTPIALNPTTWASYIQAMTAYMENWNNFNNAMLSHFHIRQENQKSMTLGWMSGRGDGDYNQYLQGLAEDRKVRGYWEVACEHHEESIRRLGEVRTAMKAETARIHAAVAAAAAGGGGSSGQR